VGFHSVQTIARLRRRVRRKGKKTIELINLISSLTLKESDAASFLRLKRGYWVIESRLHHALDVTLGDDHGRIRHPQVALALSLFRRMMVSFAQTRPYHCGLTKPPADSEWYARKMGAYDPRPLHARLAPRRRR